MRTPTKLVLVGGLLAALFACAEPGKAELDAAKKLEEQGSRSEAISAYAAIVREHPDTEAGKQAQAAIDRLECDEAKAQVGESWKALAAVPVTPVQVDPASLEAAKTAWATAKADLGACTPESTDPACGPKTTAATSAGEAYGMVVGEVAAAEARTAALEAAKSAAGAVAAGGEAPADLGAVVKDAAKAKAESVLAGLGEVPPGVDAEAVAQRVTDELVVTPEVKAAVDGRAAVEAACAPAAPAPAP